MLMRLRLRPLRSHRAARASRQSRGVWTPSRLMTQTGRATRRWWVRGRGTAAVYLLGPAGCLGSTCCYLPNPIAGRGPGAPGLEDPRAWAAAGACVDAPGWCLWLGRVAALAVTLPTVAWSVAVWGRVGPFIHAERPCAPANAAVPLQLCCVCHAARCISRARLLHNQLLCGATCCPRPTTSPGTACAARPRAASAPCSSRSSKVRCGGWPWPQGLCGLLAPLVLCVLAAAPQHLRTCTCCSALHSARA